MKPSTDLQYTVRVFLKTTKKIEGPRVGRRPEQVGLKASVLATGSLLHCGKLPGNGELREAGGGVVLASSLRVQSLLREGFEGKRCLVARICSWDWCLTTWRNRKQRE
jgi:hypothetical protein